MGITMMLQNLGKTVPSWAGLSSIKPLASDHAGR